MESIVQTAAVQFNIQLGAVERNLESVLTALRRLHENQVKLAVLPEMWSTGYDYKRLAELAEQTPRILSELNSFTAQTGMVVVGSLPSLAESKLFNTAYLVDSGALLGEYRKLHLFSVMGEDRYLAAGNATSVVSTSVGRVGMAICYDLRFPELFRKLALDGAEIVCLPAEWPKPRQEHWRTLLRARAIENQVFLAAANCCGVQGKLDFFGMSLLISPTGEILAEAAETNTEITAAFDFADMQTFRSRIPCFQERRPDIYGTLS